VSEWASVYISASVHQAATGHFLHAVRAPQWQVDVVPRSNNGPKHVVKNFHQHVRLACFLYRTCALSIKVTDWYWYVPKVPLFVTHTCERALSAYRKLASRREFLARNFLALHLHNFFIYVYTGPGATAPRLIFPVAQLPSAESLYQLSDVLPTHTWNNKYIKTWCAPRVWVSRRLAAVWHYEIWDGTAPRAKLRQHGIII
jgi:hypothetical protein